MQTLTETTAATVTGGERPEAIEPPSRSAFVPFWLPPMQEAP